MTEIELKIHGGGRLEVHGSLAAKRLLLVLSRENFRRDDPLMARLVGHFSQRRQTVLRYESEAEATLRWIDRKRFENLPGWWRQALKAFLLLLRPARWRHFFPGHRREIASIAYRARSLRELIAWLGPEKEIAVIARSASGQVGSLIADETAIGRLACLGYPFQHPDRPPDPQRYRHLERLQTPFLIVQGMNDAYGGEGIESRYRFGPNTRIHWVDTDHDFDLPESAWAAVLEEIEGFLFPDALSSVSAAASDSASGLHPNL
jgi:hypothetical protein